MLSLFISIFGIGATGSLLYLGLIDGPIWGILWWLGIASLWAGWEVIEYAFEETIEWIQKRLGIPTKLERIRAANQRKVEKPAPPKAEPYVDVSEHYNRSIGRY